MALHGTHPSMPMKLLTVFLVSFLFPLTPARGSDAPQKEAAPGIKIATFDVDVTPPLGSAMAYDPVRRLDELTLRCRGVVVTGSGRPVVLCAVDWIGIAN